MTLKWTIINGSWVQVPMVLSKTPTGFKEAPAPQPFAQSGRI